MNRVLRDTGAKYPIVQAPMGWIARSQLASAVSNAGGLGVIETSSGEVDICKEEIKKMASLTDKPFGINLPLLFLKDSSMVDFCVDNNVNFVTTSAGDPSKYIKVLKDADITVYHAVPNLQGALKAFEAGVDGLVVEGTEGGGFKGYEEIGLTVLIQAIKNEIDLPIIAAGGIVNGIGMASAFAHGATVVGRGQAVMPTAVGSGWLVTSGASSIRSWAGAVARTCAMACSSRWTQGGRREATPLAIAFSSALLGSGGTGFRAVR